jgi:hypothetical protein
MWINQRLFRWAFVGLIIPILHASGGEARYPIQGKLWKEAEVRQAYERVWRRYAVEPASRMIMPAMQLNATELAGLMDRRASDRRLVVKNGDRLVAVQCRMIIPGKPGDPVAFMVRPSGTPLYSLETATDNRQSIPQYVDVTLSFDEFVRSLQRGYCYSELPEMGVKENRKGLFRTERINVNAVEDR